MSQAISKNGVSAGSLAEDPAAHIRRAEIKSKSKNSNTPLRRVLYERPCGDKKTNTFPASGSVCIGTTSPLQTLHISGGNIRIAKICKQKKENRDVNYRFSIYENEKYFAIYLKDDKDLTVRKDDVEKFSLLSKDQYKGIPTFPDVSHKIGKQILELVKTPQFKSSSLAKAKSISMTFDDESKLTLK